MDTRSIFRDRSRTIKSRDGAGWGRRSAPIEHGASKPAGAIGFTRSSSRGGKLPGSPGGISLILASEKSHGAEAAGARTANRHGWPGARAPRWTGDPSLRN